jgi:hypothetical protein
VSWQQLHIVVRASVSRSNTKLDDTHSPLLRINFVLYAYVISLWAAIRRSPIIIIWLRSWFMPFKKRYYAPQHFRNNYSSLPCNTVFTSLLSWTELQLGDRLKYWKIWKLNILFHLKDVLSSFFRSTHSIYCTDQMHSIKCKHLITDSHNVTLL